VDYDHDGDLDLYLTFAPQGTEGKKSRNGFVAEQREFDIHECFGRDGIGSGSDGGGAVSTDFNNDRAIDLVLAGGERGADVYLNPREGKFAELPAIDFAKEKLPPAVGVVAFDFNKDGWMDLAFTHTGAPGISLWRNVEGKRLERVALPDLDGSGAGELSGWTTTTTDGWTLRRWERRERRRNSRVAESRRCRLVGCDEEGASRRSEAEGTAYAGGGRFEE